ncbi:hypothetical protein NHX12_020613, partial [Muraenolepis orangiensis]
SGVAFQVTLRDEDWIEAVLEPSDLRVNVSEYAAQLAGEARPRLIPFQNLDANSSLPARLGFNVSHRGLAYTVGLLARDGRSWSKPLRSVALLTRPLAVDTALISDYREAPETGVVFEISSPANNAFSRVNISYVEGTEPRSMLYKDFYRGKTVFKHWLPGLCYRNITFQLVSEATVNKTPVVRLSDITHRPLQHRTVPNPPRNITWKMVPLSLQRATLSGAPEGAVPDAVTPEETSQPRRARDVPLIEEQDQGEIHTDHGGQNPTEEENPTADSPAQNTAEADEDSALRTRHYDWPDPTGVPSGADRAGGEEEEELANSLAPEYEDSNEPGSALGVGGPSAGPSLVAPTKLPPILLELHWLPPAPPAHYDGFNVYISLDGNVTETATVDENTHEFFTEPTEPGTYRVLVTALSSSGDCEARESTASTAFTFYLSPGGQCLEEPKERPHSVSVRLLGSSTAAVSWGPSAESHNGSLISVLSTTCLRPSLHQRMESTYCSEENTTSDIISSLTPGAQYRVVVYHTNGPLLSPPSQPIIIDIEPTGVRDLVVYPLSPTAVILSWQRPYHVAFRKYVLQTFFFNPVTLASEWTTYYEIAATASIIRMTDMLPAWHYNFRVSMVTWGDPPLSCCDSSTISFITGGAVCALDVEAVGKKGAKKSYSIDVTHNVMRAKPAPPRSLYAVNSTHSSVTLLWSVEGVVDYYQVLCRPTRPHTDAKPAYISISTVAKEMNPSAAAISALAILSALLVSLLVLFLLVLRKKHLQMTRECRAETFVNFASFERDGKLPYNWRRSLFAFLTLLPSCLWTDYLLAFYINPWSKTALKKRKLTSPVQLDDFEAYLKDMSKDSAYKFSLQFEELKTVGLDLSHDAADLPINRPKNRYTNILPYDFSRVKLMSMHNDEGADYVNANYIPGYKFPREYIATQGPLPETRNDFWKMVLQEKSPIIVMLTQCNERRRVKCDHYWPFTDEPVMYGEVSVEMLSESESPEWTIRNFRLGYADESQDVLHLNYTSWPDHGVPTVNAIESILQFVLIVRQQANKSKDPVVVHCSAGVGRTGTFMALDRLMQQIREHEYADILGMVSEMRSHRLSMVQTEEQYVFIHQCVLLMWKKKKQQSIITDVIYENISKT